MTPAVIFDIDGTLVDTNYQHALAWFRAFRQHDVIVPVWVIHRAIGMGGDQLVSAVAGEEVEAQKGDAIREAEKPLYMSMVDEVQAFEGATEVLRELGDRGHKLVLASSAKQDEVDRYVELLGADDLVADWTSSADVDATKPQPDIVEAALDKAGTREAVMVGDAVWDVEAARRAAVPTIGVLSGGFARSELLDAGAAEVFDSIGGLRERPDTIDAVAAK
ncbi:MAG: HAD-superfamily hydrolase, subfamily variant 3 [Solirubrobacterales bacterium]|jgi:HAD superfamily hydrolase (TIGR01549 family)|nr:HAD-superfamily hydrolase, subfamily variant 3 [Solirubrobacterales bacterium]